MLSSNNAASANDRRGITLLEVLISVGILAIGLSSVLSLIPVGKAEVGKAVIIDRSVVMARNAMADAVTFGYTRPASFVTANDAAATVVFDPTVRDQTQSLATQVNGPDVVTSGTLKAVGVWASPGSVTPAALAVGLMFAQGRDDLTFTAASADDPPLNVIVNGVRAFQGRTTCLAALSLADTDIPPLAPGKRAVLSIVVFHNRDINEPFLSASLSSTGLLELTEPLPAGKSIRAIIRPDAVIALSLGNRLRFGQLAMAAADAVTNSAYVSFSGADLAPSLASSPINVWVLVDSVALLERAVRLEGPNNFSP
jgi:type II secretory pathway pseudopilin PulG